MSFLVALADFPLALGQDDSIMASLVSSLESSIIESLRKNVRTFCKNAAELSFMMPSSATIKYESLPGGHHEGKNNFCDNLVLNHIKNIVFLSDNDTTNDGSSNSDYDTINESDLEIIMGSSTGSPFKFDTLSHVSGPMDFQNWCTAESQSPFPDPGKHIGYSGFI
jgi:hypothetical protein